MFSIAVTPLFGQDAVNRRPAYAESGRNGAGRFTADVHPLRRSSFLQDDGWRALTLPSGLISMEPMPGPCSSTKIDSFRLPSTTPSTCSHVSLTSVMPSLWGAPGNAAITAVTSNLLRSATTASLSDWQQVESLHLPP